MSRALWREGALQARRVVLEDIDEESIEESDEDSTEGLDEDLGETLDEDLEDSLSGEERLSEESRDHSIKSPYWRTKPHLTHLMPRLPVLRYLTILSILALSFITLSKLPNYLRPRGRLILAKLHSQPKHIYTPELAKSVVDGINFNNESSLWHAISVTSIGLDNVRSRAAAIQRFSRYPIMRNLTEGNDQAHKAFERLAESLNNVRSKRRVMFRINHMEAEHRFRETQEFLVWETGSCWVHKLAGRRKKVRKLRAINELGFQEGISAARELLLTLYRVEKGLDEAESTIKRLHKLLTDQKRQLKEERREVAIASASSKWLSQARLAEYEADMKLFVDMWNHSEVAQECWFKVMRYVSIVTFEADHLERRLKALREEAHRSLEIQQQMVLEIAREAGDRLRELEDSLVVIPRVVSSGNRN